MLMLARTRPGVYSNDRDGRIGRATTIISMMLHFKVYIEVAVKFGPARRTDRTFKFLGC